MIEQPIQHAADPTADASARGEGGQGEAGGDPADPDPCSSLSITIATADADADPPDADWLTRRLGEAIDQLGLDAVELSVAIVDDATMSRLHGEHLDDPTTTDVLSFDLRDEPWVGRPAAGAAPAVDGELVLCLDEARRRAAERGHSADRELLLYAVHGLLHLLGHDDHDETEAAGMHAQEDALLEAIGVGRTYAG